MQRDPSGRWDGVESGEDELAGIRGLAFALLISVPLWAAIIALARFLF